jgi:hypothetical protein
MPEIQDITVDDVVADGRDLGLPPEEIAGAVKQWRDQTLDWASANHGDSDPEGYFRGADELDTVTAQTLGTLRQEAAAQWADQAFDHPDTRAEFFDAYQAVDGQPKMMPGFAGEAEQLNQLAAHEAFSLPKRNPGWLPVTTGDGNELGRFTQRQRADGSVEALLDYQSEQAAPTMARAGNYLENVINPYAAGAKMMGYDTPLSHAATPVPVRGTARLVVPGVKPEDVTQARAAAEAKVQMAQEQLQRNEASAAAGGADFGEGSQGMDASNASWTRTLREQALRARALADPQQGTALLMSERVAEAIKAHPVLREQVGQRGLGEDFMRGVLGFYTGARVAWNDVTGDDAERDQWRQHLSNLGQMFPGSTQRRNVGGVPGFISDAAEGMGGMAPQLAIALGSGGASLASTAARAALKAGGGTMMAGSLGSMGVSAYGSGVNEVLSRADALDAQAKSLAGVMPDMAAEMRAEAQGLRENHRAIAGAKAANEVASEFIFPEETMFTKGIAGKNVLTRFAGGAVKSFAEGAAAETGGQVINNAAFGDALDLAGIGRGGLLEAAAGAPMLAAGSFKAHDENNAKPVPVVQRSAAAIGSGSVVSPPTVDITPTPSPVVASAPSKGRIKMAAKVLSTQGVDAEVAAHFGAQLATSLPDDLAPEEFRDQVMAGFAAAGGVLPGSVTKAYVEEAAAYEAQGYTPQQAAEHAANAQAANAAATEAAHQKNRDLLHEAQVINLPAAEVTKRANDELDADFEAFAKRYEAEHGRTLDADRAKELFRDYSATSATRAKHSSAVYPPAQRLVDKLFERWVNEPGAGPVVFTSGGPGAGKTRLLEHIKGAMPVAPSVIMDGTLSDTNRAAANIAAARKAGKKVVIWHVNREFSDAVNGVIDRALDPANGRAVPLHVTASKHAGARRTFQELRQKFANDPGVTFEAQNTSADLQMQPMPVAAVGFDLPGSVDIWKKQAYEILDERTRAANEAGKPIPEGTRQALNVREGVGGSRASGDQEQAGPGRALGAGEKSPAGGVSASDQGGPGASSVTEWRKSSFGKRLKADERLRASWRDAMSKRMYRKESEAEWQQRANDFIAEHGLEGAAAIYFDAEAGLSPSDRMALVSQLSLSIDAEIRQAERAGDADRVAMLDDLLHELTEDADKTATKLGQAIRVLGMWTRMSAEGVLRMFTKKVDTAREESLKTVLGKEGEEIAADVTTAAKEEQADVAAEALGETPADQLAELQRQVDELRQQLATATREAQAARQEATQAATPAEAAPAEQRADAAEGKRKKAQRALKAAEEQQARKAQQAGKPRKPGEKKPKAINAQDLAARLINRLAESQSDTPADRQAAARRKNQVQQLAADYAAGRIDGPALQAALQALGIDAASAATLNQLLDNETRRGQAIDHARAQQRQREAPAKLINEWIDRLATSQSDTPQTRKQGKINALAQLIRDYLKAPDAASLPDFISQASALGAPETQATQLKTLLDTERRNLAAIARERAIARLVDQITPKLAGPRTRQRVPRFLQKLFDAHELGAISRPEFLKAYAEAFELPVMDAAMQRKIRALIDAQRAAPEGFLKQEATTKLMAELALFKGIPAMEIGTAFWYANILSGLTTQGINLWGNGINLLLRTLSIGATHNPVETWHFMRGLFEGARRGLTEAKAALMTGEVPFKGDLKFTGGQTLELLHSDNPATWQGRLMNGVALGRFVFRALSAGDAFFFHTAREGRAWLAAARYANEQGKGAKVPFAQYLAEQLQNDGATFQAALDQARGEFTAANRRMKVGELQRRAWEIIEEKRPPELTEDARRFGTWSTFNQEPEGTMGAIAGLVNEAHRRLSLPSPWGPIRILTPLIPFVNIVANVTSSALDFTPIGITRGMLGRHMRNVLDKGANDFSPWEARQRMASGVLGTLGSGLLFAWAYAMKDDDDDRVPFMIYGMGPGTKARRDQMPKGWKPFTMKIGRNYVSYAETPLSLILAITGNTLDYLRYTPKGKEEHALGAATYALATSPQALLKTGVLSSINDVFALLEGTRSVKQLAARTATGFIPGQALLRDISELFHGDKIDDTTLAAALLKDVPVVRGLAGKPALNIFGEPVKLDVMQRLPIIKRIATGQGTDPTSQWLAQNKLWIPGVDTKVAVTKYLTEADKFTLASDGVAQLTSRRARLAGDVLTEPERYRLIQDSGPMLRTAVKQLQADLNAGWQPQPGQLQSRLSAKVVAARRTVMKKIAGIE